MNEVMTDMTNVTRCYKCRNWHNFSMRKQADDVSPEDLGLCSKFRTVMEAAGFCSRASEVEEE